MSTTPQMSHMSQMSQNQGQQQAQQGPSTAPPQPFGQQQGVSQAYQQGMPQQQGISQAHGQQGMPQQQGISQAYGQQGPLQQQLQQLGQQQPYQQLLQQLAQVSGAAIRNNVATQYWDVIQPLPGNPTILYLLVDNVWRQLNNPSQTVHDEVQRAFAFGHRVLGFYDDQNPNYLQAIVVNK